MAGEERKCPNCGARPTRTTSQFCEYCGTEFPRVQAESTPPASPFENIQARFQALGNHPGLSELMDYTPPSRALRIHTGMSLAFLAIFAAAGLAIAVVFFSFCPPIGFLPLAIVIFGGYAMSKQLSKTSRAHSAPLERLPALVADARTKVSSGDENRSAKTHYYATLQFADGSRRELDAFSNVAGKITRGDMGIAYIKGEFLLAFGRLPV